KAAECAALQTLARNFKTLEKSRSVWSARYSRALRQRRRAGAPHTLVRRHFRSRGRGAGGESKRTCAPRVPTQTAARAFGFPVQTPLTSHSNPLSTNPETAAKPGWCLPSARPRRPTILPHDPATGEAGSRQNGSSKTTQESSPTQVPPERAQARL